MTVRFFSALLFAVRQRVNFDLFQKGLQMQNIRKLFSLALFFVCIAPLQAQTTVPTSSVPGVDATNYPRVGGSSSTYTLGWLLAARAWNAPAELRRGPMWSWQPKGSVGLTFPLETTPESISDYWRALERNNHNGTHADYEALARGTKDLILVARKPSANEQALGLKQKVAFELRPVALDALVFLVNRQNKVENLSRLQLQAVFARRTKLWRMLGGADWPVLALTRNEDSGSEELFTSEVMGGARLVPGEPNTRLSTMEDVIDRVAKNRNAIGYSVFYFERFLAPRPENKLLAIDGIAPTSETIASGRYPFVTPVYVVVRAGLPKDSPTTKLRDWLLTDEGQKLVAQSGYVPNAIAETPR